jgi:GcrA cell cycle regulator
MSHANHAYNAWTEQERETLRELWPTARSAAEIAEVLDGRTKNAIIGEAHRLNLPRKKTGPRAEPKVKKEKPPTTPPPKAKDFLFGSRLVQKAEAAKAPPPNDEAAQPQTLLLDDRGFAVDLVPVPPPQTAVRIAELTLQHCRWPYGNGKDIQFCGKPCVSGLSYCASHCRNAHRTPH